MALKIIQLKNKIEIAKRSLDEMAAKDAEFEKRAADIENVITTAETLDEMNAADEVIENYENDLKTHNDAKRNLSREIAEMESELNALDEPIDTDAISRVETENGKEKRTMDINEIRSSKEYLHAWTEAVKTGDEREVRSLITENTTNGTIPVPVYVESRVRTAWESDGFVSRIAKTYVKGNLTIMHENGSSPAVVHTEGSGAPQEENLELGKVTLVPATIKKWIGVSDEALSMTDEAFVDYIYDELTYRIIKKFRDDAIVKIANSALTLEPTVPASITQAILVLLGALSDEATNPVIMMSKTAWSRAKIEALNAGYAIDPFAGLDVLFNDTLHNSSTGQETIIVGDLKGYHANFPNGQTVRVIADEKAKEDMVEFVGKLLVGHDVVAPNMIAWATLSGGGD